MSTIIKPQIRKTSELPFHTDDAPGKRFVFVEKNLYPQSEFYIIGRRVEEVPQNQQDYVNPHRHNCNSFYFFIGDDKNLSGLEAKIDIEGNTLIAESPFSVMIPQTYLHHYKLTKGRGWFFHVVPKPSYEKSIITGNDTPIDLTVNISSLLKGFEKRTKRPSVTERPIGASSGNELKNPQRYLLVSPEIFPKAGIYAALHQIFSDTPFDLNQQLNYHETDEIYILFSKKGESLRINMFSSEKDKVTAESPTAIYHQRGEAHKYDYINGQGFVLVVLKEKNPGEGYKFISV